MATSPIGSLTRVQLQNISGLDQKGVFAFVSLFNALVPYYALEPGDIVCAASLTRNGALLANAAAVSRTLYPNLYAALVESGIVAITIAAPGVVAWVANGLPANTPIVFTTTGALPTGLVAGTVYYVKTPGANSFTVSATPGGAAITTTGAQSGTHTATAWPYGNGDGSTTFNVPNFPAANGCNYFVMY